MAEWIHRVHILNTLKKIVTWLYFISGILSLEIFRSQSALERMKRYSLLHDDVIKWKHFPRHWPFVRGIHRSPVNSPHKGQWRRALMFSLICDWLNRWVNNREAGDFRRHRAHHDVVVMVRFYPSVQGFHILIVPPRWGTVMPKYPSWEFIVMMIVAAATAAGKCIVGLCLVLLYKTTGMAWRWPSGMVDCFTFPLARHTSSINSILLHAKIVWAVEQTRRHGILHAEE